MSVRSSKRLLALLRLAVFALVLPSVAFANGLPGFSSWGDFAALARYGFSETVDGSFPSLVPNDGDANNSYSWSIEEHNGEIYVGTVRYLSCLSGFGTNCPPPSGFGFFPEIDETFAGQIWRYTPGAPAVEGSSNANAINGSWSLQHESSAVGLLVSLFTDFLDATDPVDFGYRNLESCQTLGDASPVLYSANIGIWGRIHWLNEVSDTWELANEFDLFSVLGDLIAGGQNLGYRALKCFKGRLWTSPAGNAFEGFDPDIPAPGSGIVLVNDDPTDAGVWEEASIENFGFATEGPVEPANILGIFTLGVWDLDGDGVDDPEDLLVAGTVDRDYGSRIMVTTAEDCPPYPCTWQELGGSPGAARPEVLGKPNPDGFPPVPPPGTRDLSFGVSSNAGVADIEQLGSDLYVSYSESAANAGVLAELIRFNAPPAPVGGETPPEGVCAEQICDVTWDVVIGYPRPLALATDDPTFACSNMVDVSISPAEGPDFRCFPTSGLGLGAAEEPLTADDTGDPLDNFAAGGFGRAFYFWRLETHTDPDPPAAEVVPVDVLYATTFERASLNLPGIKGWDLWKSSDGDTWSRVFGNSAGFLDSFGGRVALSTTDGLYLGSASLDEGTNVLLGTSAPVNGPGGFAPAVFAEAAVTPGTNFDTAGAFAFDDENIVLPTSYADTSFFYGAPTGDGSEEFSLNGFATGLFGATITGFEWFFDTDVTSFEGTTPCADLSSPDVPSTLDPSTVTSADAGDPPLTTYFTLRATDNFGNVACDSVPIEVSSNLPPFSIIETDPPLTANAGFFGEPQLLLVDWNNDGSEIFEVMGQCLDVGLGPVACTWDFPRSDDVQLQTTPEDLEQFMQAPRADLATDPAADVDLVAMDELGFDNLGGWDVVEVDDNLGNMTVTVQSVQDTVEGINDVPYCQNARGSIMAGSFRIVDPLGATIPGPVLCGDADGDELSWTLGDDPEDGPNFGAVENDAATGLPKYVHTEGGAAEGISPLDYFHYRADDGVEGLSPEVIFLLDVESPGFDLTVSDPTEGFSPGGAIRFEVSGIQDGERARIYLSRQLSPGDGPCGPDGSPCLNLIAPFAQLSTTAAVGGVAAREVNVPAGAMSGKYLVQALVLRGGPSFASSIKSNVVEFEVSAPAGP